MRGSRRLLLLAPLLLAACKSTVDTTGQTSDGFPAPDREMVWMAAERALAQQGFVLDPVSSSKATGVLKTRWDLSMQPFSGQGYRDQATVRIRDLPKTPDRFTVETNVIRQRNSNMTEPSNPVAADWTDGERVPDLENLITRRIEMVFLSPDVSSQFRSSRGMAPGTSGRVEAPPAKPKKDPWAWAYPK
jgi:hypothetical protein